MRSASPWLQILTACLLALLAGAPAMASGGRCVTDIEVAFIEAGTLEGLDTACIER